MNDAMLTLAEAAAALGLPPGHGADAAFVRVTTDSRDVRPGDLFVALRGDRFDGHDFVAQALTGGAVGALVEAYHPALAALGDRAPLLVVADPLAALGQLAAAWRARFALPLAAITGSSGKTTVKEMVAAVLRHVAGDAAVLATAGNLNNHIGVPQMLLRLRPEHRYAVIEMGMNHYGEIRYLTGLARPEVALVNNAGTAHIGHFGSTRGIAEAKGEIFEGLSAGGCAVINLDDEFAGYWQGLAADHRQLGFGLEQGEVRARALAQAPLSSRFVLLTPAGEAPVELPAPGLHNVRNALAAAAVCHALGLAPAQIAAGLATFAGAKGRLQLKRAFNGALLVDDSYNANPDSIRAAIDVLAGLPGARWLVLGDTGEIDDVALRHAELGAYARGKGFAGFYAVGEDMRHAVEAYGEGARWFAGHAELAAALRPQLAAGDSVLVKGSRFMRMEQVVDALAAAATENDKGEA